MDWRELEALIREERRNGNPVAGHIHSLQLDQNKITLLLSNLLDSEEVRGCRRAGRTPPGGGGSNRLVHLGTTWEEG